MLTGKLPFQGRTQQEMMIARLRNEPIPLRQRRPGMDFPEGVEKVLLKAMARNADDRHATTLEFAAELQEAVNGGSSGAGAGGGVLGKIFGR